MAVKNYDPKQVSLIVGSAPAHGYADGDFITVARNEDSFSLLVGSDGESTRSKSSNRSGKVTLRLMASSSFNDTLSELSAADEISGSAVFPLMVKDNFGTSIYTAATAWIAKPAEAAFGKEGGTREWVIETDELLAFAGGNN